MLDGEACGQVHRSACALPLAPAAGAQLRWTDSVDQRRNLETVLEMRWPSEDNGGEAVVEVLVSAELGFQVADGEDVSLSFDAGDLVLRFKDWREQDIQHRFVEALAFRWASRPTLPTPRDDSTYEVRDSTWLREEMRHEGDTPSSDFAHRVLCFNASKVLEVISRR